MKLYERVDASLRRAPYVWLALTLVVIIAVMIPAARPLVEEKPGSASWISWVALALIVYTCGAGLFFSSPQRASRTRNRMTDDRFAVVQWTFGVAPTLFGFAGTAGNGKGWPLAIGVLASAILLTLFARQLAHEPSV